MPSIRELLHRARLLFSSPCSFLCPFDIILDSLAKGFSVVLSFRTIVGGSFLMRKSGLAVVVAILVILPSMPVVFGYKGHTDSSSVNDATETSAISDDEGIVTELTSSSVPSVDDEIGIGVDMSFLSESQKWKRPVETRVLEDRVIYTYESLPQSAMIPSVGDVVSGLDESGSTRQVEDVSIEGNTVTIYTTTTESPKSANSEQIGNSNLGTNLVPNIDIWTPPALEIAYEERIDNSYGSALIRANALFQLSVRAHVSVQFDWIWLRSAAIILYVDFEASMSLEVNGTINWRQRLGGAEYTSPDFWVLGWIPVSMSLYWSLVATFDAEGHLAFGAAASASKAYGIIYSEGKWSNYESEEEPTIIPTYDAEIDAEAKLSMPFGIQTSVFHSFGLNVSFEPYVRAFFSASLSGIDYGVFVGIDIALRFKIVFFEVTLADWLIPLLSWELKIFPDASMAPSPPSIVSHSIDYSYPSPWVNLRFKHSDLDNSSNLTEYEIQRSPWMSPVSLPITDSTEASWTDRETNTDSKYNYSIVAVDKNGTRGRPANLTVDVLHNQILPPAGLLRVFTNPSVNSSIYLNGTKMGNWSFDWAMLTPGSYNVSFGDVPGYVTPPAQTVEIVVNETTYVEGRFIKYCNLRIVTSPPVPTEIYVNGTLKGDWSFWGDLPPGMYNISFGPVQGFITPSPRPVTLMPGEKVFITVTFVKCGILRVTTSPPVWAEICVDEAEMGTWGIWIHIAPGLHTVSFGSIQGLVSPQNQTISVESGENVWIIGRYAALATSYILRPCLDRTVEWTYPLPTAHWCQVDEFDEGGDGNASYVETTSFGCDRYELADSPLFGVGNLSLTIWAIVCKSAGSTPGGLFNIGLHINGFDYFSSDSLVPVPYTWTNVTCTWLENPATSEAWTEDDLNGVSVVIMMSMTDSIGPIPTMRVTQVAALVLLE